LEQSPLYYYMCPVIDKQGTYIPSCVYGPSRDTPQEAEAAWDLLMGGEESNRKLLQAIITPENTILAFCTDGSIFHYTKTSSWIPIEPIPGTEVDR